MYETIELTTAHGDTVYLYAVREPVMFEYENSNHQHIYCADADSYAYTHGGERYRAACDAIAEYLVMA
ncbi:hypothetical protein HUU62_08510 [Rhodoferax sp. 4810]|uniref:Uncharacterized protein n=1 Tax=Thiospirillum jenense TaxID=1653858 RepID=A0A839H927_9GAMM|nr:hypothetical protein [Thiospirillum jenense]MBB1074450.1 hypothetical protein [Rhodoferax jenense]MBB1125571.1 hypothetical protein [Thiospirillum jenense]